MEHWKQIEFGNGKYSVSDSGNVKNNITGKLLSSQIQNSGYRLVHLHDNGKRKASTIHRLVALAFIDNPELKTMVDHIDCNKLNNHVSNLRWVTACENGKYAVENGLFKNAALKAKDRMKKIGRAFSKANGERLIAMNAKKRKPVLQLSLKGEFIKEWPSVRAIRNANIAHNVGKVLKGIYEQSGGYKWIFKEPDPHQKLTMDL
jgi:hypothetical protein